MTTVEARRGSRRGVNRGMALAIGVPVLAFVVLVGGWLLRTHTSYVGTNSIGPRFQLPGLAPGQRMCSRGITLPGNANALRVEIAGAPGASVPATMRLSVGGRTQVSHGFVPGGRLGAVFRFKPVGHDSAASWCLTSRAGLASAGSVSASAYTGVSSIDGKPIGQVSQAYLRLPARRLLSALPAGARHASAFRAGFVGAWTYWLLVPLILVLWLFGLRLVIRGTRS